MMTMLALRLTKMVIMALTACGIAWAAADGPTFDMPAANDISNHSGIFTHDGRPKAWAACRISVIFDQGKETR